MSLSTYRPPQQSDRQEWWAPQSMRSRKGAETQDDEDEVLLRFEPRFLVQMALITVRQTWLGRQRAVDPVPGGSATLVLFGNGRYHGKIASLKQLTSTITISAKTHWRRQCCFLQYGVRRLRRSRIVQFMPFRTFPKETGTACPLASRHAGWLSVYRNNTHPDLAFAQLAVTLGLNIEEERLGRRDEDGTIQCHSGALGADRVLILGG